ncbi:MAG: metal-binding protein, partial [Bacillota bacterium]
FKYAEAPTTVLVAKDRVLAHNPAGALYCADGYFKNKLFL